MNKKNNYSLLGNLYNSFFVDKKVFLKNQNMNLQVQFIKFEDNRVYLRINDEHYKQSKSTIYVRLSDEVIFSQIKPISQIDSLFLFEPENIQVLLMPRKEERTEIDPVKEGDSLYVSNIISDFMIKDALTLRVKIVERIKWEIEKKINDRLKDVKIVFSHERGRDDRMKFFFNKRLPIFVPNILDTSKVEAQIELYKEKIYNKEENGNFISEASVPFLYKGMIPFGYIQYMSGKPIAKDDYIFLKKFCASTSELLSKDSSLFTPSLDRMKVGDLSLSGLSALFSKKTMIKNFKKDSLTLFTLYLPNNKQATILSQVKNISILDSNDYKIGCAIEYIDPIGEVNYSDYLAFLPMAGS